MKIPVILPGLALCLLLSLSNASAQVDPGKCDSCWKHWSFDSTMTLAAHLAQSVSDAVNLYHFRLSQDYGINDPNEIPMQSAFG